MRSALLCLLAAAPVSALAAPATGSVDTDSSYINAAQCAGVANTDVGLDDSVDLGLTWTTALVSGKTFSSGGEYRIFAANYALDVGSSVTSPSCEVELSTNTSHSDFQSTLLADSISAGSQSVTSTHTFAMSEVVSAAGYGCDVIANKKIYLCVEWRAPSSGDVEGWATGSVTLDVVGPATGPVISKVGPGDGKLYATCEEGSSSLDGYKAKATSAADAADVHFSKTADSCSNLEIGGLTNDQAYDVVVYGLDPAHNPSPASATVSGKPVPTEDFWDRYHERGGADSGGCNSAGAAAGLLSALSLVVALRRRKP